MYTLTRYGMSQGGLMYSSDRFVIKVKIEREDLGTSVLTVMRKHGFNAKVVWSKEDWSGEMLCVVARGVTEEFLRRKKLLDKNQKWLWGKTVCLAVDEVNAVRVGTVKDMKEEVTGRKTLTSCTEVFKFTFTKLGDYEIVCKDEPYWWYLDEQQDKGKIRL